MSILLSFVRRTIPQDQIIQGEGLPRDDGQDAEAV
jgi:hypothetical protein